MSGSRISDLLEGITIEDVLDKCGFDYKITHGSSGEQVNVESCPICGGNDWKVYLNRDSGLGNCFHGTCQSTFNVFSFARAALGTEQTRPVAEFLENLAQEIGWRPARRRKSVDVERDDSVGWALPDSYALPTRDGRNLSYLEQRGIDAQTAHRFGLRYCHRGWFSFVAADGAEKNMPFHDRVLIPIYDLDATLVTFQGRDITGKAERKYLFPPGLPGSGAFLYDAHRAFGKSQAILVEGIFDVIRTWLQTRGTAFDEAAVIGSFGIQLSKGNDGKDQVSQLLRLKASGLREVTVMWDGERKAFLKALDACRTMISIGLACRIACLPAGADPGAASGQMILSALETAIVADAAVMLRWRIKPPYSR